MNSLESFRAEQKYHIMNCNTGTLICGCNSYEGATEKAKEYMKSSGVAMIVLECVRKFTPFVGTKEESL